MIFLLDTNVVSELRKLKQGRTDRNFAAWSEAVSTDLLYVSVITLFEIENGILTLERRDPTQAAVLRRWFEQTYAQLQGRIMGIDADTSLFCAKLFVPDPRPWRDAFIGATAAVHGFTLVTRNVRDFQGLDIAIVNPWAPAG